MCEVFDTLNPWVFTGSLAVKDEAIMGKIYKKLFPDLI